MFGDLKLGPWWNYEVPRALGVQYHLQNLEFKTPIQKFCSLKQSTRFKCLSIWNWVLTSTAWTLVQSCSKLQSSLKTIGPTKIKQKKKDVNWNFNIHVIYFLCFCKHQVAYEEYELKMFVLKNLIFTSYSFLESYPRWEKKKGRKMSHCEPYILFLMPHELMSHV
jgi:hypothetical protein